MCKVNTGIVRDSGITPLIHIVSAEVAAVDSDNHTYKCKYVGGNSRQDYSIITS